ncbi:glycine cleavage system aminomethyltransferase GcvT [bacterium]|nr:MAG: glycine cleavage system aminomethyltransferase GcvT [bacterium]
MTTEILNVEPPKPTHQRTSLFEAHQQCGGKIVPFAGWELPVQYAGVKIETLAVRENCGLFDVGHMGQFDVWGEGATAFLNSVVTADWSKTRVGRASYGLLLTETGGVLDDVMGYRLEEERWLVVVNASRVENDEALLRSLLPSSVSFRNRLENQAMIAVQGLGAEAILQSFCNADLSSFAFRDVREVEVMGETCIVARGGYTGCDGFEWMGSAQVAPALWSALLEKGAVPCGLGARDVLRLEAGLPLYGHELRENLTPYESGVAFAVKFDKGDFHGRDELLKGLQNPSEQTIRGVQMLGRGIARDGYAVSYGGKRVGEITSGTPSPTLDKNIALALLPTELALGSEIEVHIRGAVHPAQVVSLPFVPRSTKPAQKIS